MSKSGFRDSPPAPRCAVNSCYRLDQLNLRMVGCKVVLWNEMISYSCFATLMRSFKSLKQAFYQHENNSTSSDGLMDACFIWGCSSVARARETDQPERPKVRVLPSPWLYCYSLLFENKKKQYMESGAIMASWQSLVYCEWPEPICAAMHRRFESSWCRVLPPEDL